jgi:hypothetical protein
MGSKTRIFFENQNLSLDMETEDVTEFLSSFPQVKALAKALRLARDTLNNTSNPLTFRIMWTCETINEALAPFEETDDDQDAYLLALCQTV